MTISIVMSVYNGQRFLLPQLDSIKNQTKPADEVIILDDGSTDESYQIIKNYIQENLLDNWSLEKNPQNYGWKRSFYTGISKCTGDIIFTCDQDDVWVKDKIEVMSSAIINNPDIELLVADYVAFQYDNLPESIGKKTNKVEQLSLGDKWKYIQRPGCVFAFTKRLQKRFVTCWRDNFAHDLLLWELAGVEKTLYHIDYIAILFRRHDSNSTPPKARSRELRLKLAVQSLGELNDLKRWEQNFKADKEIINRIEKAIKFEDLRVSFFKTDKFDVLLAVKLLFYSGCYLNRLAWGLDITCRLK